MQTQSEKNQTQSSRHCFCFVYKAKCKMQHWGFTQFTQSRLNCVNHQNTNNIVVFVGKALLSNGFLLDKKESPGSQLPKWELNTLFKKVLPSL